MEYRFLKLDTLPAMLHHRLYSLLMRFLQVSSDESLARIGQEPPNWIYQVPVEKLIEAGIIDDPADHTIDDCRMVAEARVSTVYRLACTQTVFKN